MPANIGELTLTLDSELNKHKQIFAPNVLILDQNMTPAAFFPSTLYLSAAGRDADRRWRDPRRWASKSSMCWCLPLKDLQQTTTLLDPAKAYAKGAGNAARISGSDR